MDKWTVQEQAYKRGFEKGYEQGCADTLNGLKEWLTECQKAEKGLRWAVIAAVIAKVDQMSAEQKG